MDSNDRPEHGRPIYPATRTFLDSTVQGTVRMTTVETIPVLPEFRDPYIMLTPNWSHLVDPGRDRITTTMIHPEQATLFNFFRWYDRDLGHFAPRKHHLIVAFRSYPHADVLKARIFTKSNVYSIKATLSWDTKGPMRDGEHLPTSYLGANASSRTARPGEDWRRGRDMREGLYTEDTWRNILNDILGYELMSVCVQAQDEVWGLGSPNTGMDDFVGMEQLGVLELNGQFRVRTPS